METGQGDEDKRTYEKTYVMGDIGSGARVQQGEHLSWVEGIFAGDSADERLLRHEFMGLRERITTDPQMDEATREVSIAKAKEVAEALSQAHKEPGRLRRALMDAKAWFQSSAGWAWESLSEIMASDAAQKMLGTITEAGIRAAILSLIGPR
jgi:hypothetical protein